MKPIFAANWLRPPITIEFRWRILRKWGPCEIDIRQWGADEEDLHGDECSAEGREPRVEADHEEHRESPESVEVEAPAAVHRGPRA